MTRKMKKAMTVFCCFFAFSLMPSLAKADGMFCLENIEVGAEYLYWQPCVGDMDLVVRSHTDSSTNIDHNKTKYIDPDYDSGYKVWVGAENVVFGLGGEVVYTHFSTSKSKSVHATGDDSLLLSTSNPASEDLFGDSYAHGKWDLYYQSVDAVMRRPLQVTCDNKFKVEAFSGMTWMKFDQKRHDYLTPTANFSTGPQLFIHRSLEYWGVGPVLGVKSEYNIWNCLKTFSSASTTFLVGESHVKDSFKGTALSTVFHSKYKSKDKCACFPGLHLTAGIAYETCLCDTLLSLRLGWEYVHWINATGFPYYEYGESGVRSANSEHSLTLQGLTAGLNVSF